MINYLTPKEVSETLKISMSTTYKLFALRGFPKIQLGKKYIVSEESLNEFLKSHERTVVSLV